LLLVTERRVRRWEFVQRSGSSEAAQKPRDHPSQPGGMAQSRHQRTPDRARGRELQPHREHSEQQRSPRATITLEAYCIRRQRQNAALHESGHTVIGVKVGNGVDRVELWPGVQEDGSIPEGITTFRDFRSLSRETGIKLLLAGPLAEKRIGVLDWQGCSDFDRIANLLRGSGLDFKAR